MATSATARSRHSPDALTSRIRGAVIVEPSLGKVDDLMHLSRRLRRIALQSAVGGMALSFIGMLVAAAGYLPPVAGALAQELIDLAVVFNALRVSIAPVAVLRYPLEALVPAR